MNFTLPASADRGASTAAALVGAGLGFGLGAVFLFAGLSKDAAADVRVDVAAQEIALAERPYDLIDPSEIAPPASAPMRDGLRGAHAPPSAPVERVLAVKTARSLDCLTEAVYYEARGETPKGQAAVAQVVMNRVRHPAFPSSVCGVVYQGANGRGCQFSFACNGAMHARRESAAWRNARRIATAALSGTVVADIGSATHFHTTGVSPNWGPSLARVSQVGLHVFYRLATNGVRAAVHREPAKSDDAPRVVYASLLPMGGARDLPEAEIELAPVFPMGAEAGHAAPDASSAASAVVKTDEAVTPVAGGAATVAKPAKAVSEQAVPAQPAA